ncbi:MAG TPA: AAA family ATPase [Candidatus Faecalibacterium avium]|nr:AAA family ATPase [Candidatus Faecalibacterium avium]
MIDLPRMLLAALLGFPQYIPEAAGRLTPDDFPEGLGDLYAAIDGTWSAKGEMDVVDVLHRYPDLKETVAACMDALDVAPVKVTRSRVREWVTALLERRALERFQALAVQAASPSTSYEDLAALYGRMGQALDTDRPGEDFTPIGDLIDDYIRNLDQQPNYIQTGIGPLDRNLHILPGNFILIGGRPSAGKTALSLQIAVEMAKQGRKVCYFSLETSSQILAQRIIANQLYAPLEQVKTKKVPAAELDGLSKLRKLPLYIRSASGRNVAWIRAQALRMKAQVVMVDYVQIIRPDRSGDRYQAITQISIALHELAQTTGMVVIGAAQLSRNAAHTLPSNADLKESGQLEQDADAVLLLGNAEDGHSVCILSKNKEGRVGEIPLAFDKERQRFLEVVP